jgi:hypothetical protein
VRGGSRKATPYSIPEEADLPNFLAAQHGSLAVNTLLNTCFRVMKWSHAETALLFMLHRT